MKTLRNLIFLSGFLFCASFHAQADLLGVDAISTLPELASGTLAIQYTASSGLFTVSGDTSFYTAPDATGYSVTTNDWSAVGTFDLSANIATNGYLLSGTVTIVGGVRDDFDNEIYPWGTLLQGNLTAFGYQDLGTGGPDKFDFRFDVTGGALAGVYGSLGGILIDTTEESPFAGTFMSDFGNPEQVWETVGNTAMIPEPEPQLLIILSVLGLCWVARWRAPLRKG